MRRTTALTLLALASTTLAARWEYATLTEAAEGLVWTPPGGKGALFDKGGSYANLLKAAKCPAGTSPRLDFFNCVGRQGWEYAGQLIPGGTQIIHLFKRAQ